MHFDSIVHCFHFNRLKSAATVRMFHSTHQIDICTTCFNMPKETHSQIISRMVRMYPKIFIYLNVFEKYMKRVIPSEATLRNKYVPLLYNQSIADMRTKAANNWIWLALDETQDSQRRYVSNFIFGLMENVNDNNPERGKCYLLNMAILESSNANCVFC